jgi:hypothetical protein
MVTEDAVTWEEHISLEVANSIRVLGSGSGVIRGTGLFPVFTGGANGMAVASASSQTKGNLIQESSYSEPLNMGKREVSKLIVPSEPNFLKWGEIAVG